ncbi:MAG: 50S ribosomal protein L21 [Spirochaetaceae bacterium]|nr:50S ribosomal protein L21 [Spirochaetaceae bacterium]
MYALIDYKGKQYKVAQGDEILVDRLNGEVGSKVEIDSVLLLKDGDSVSVGAPYVNGAKVSATISENIRSRKVLVYKYESKKDYHKMYGHRQHYTRIKIDSINA